MYLKYFPLRSHTLLCLLNKNEKCPYAFNLDYELTIYLVNRRKESRNSEFVLNELMLRKSCLLLHIV